MNFNVNRSEAPLYTFHLFVRMSINGALQYFKVNALIICYYCSHEGVQDTDSKGCATSEGLSEIQLSVGIVIVVVWVNELDVGVIHELGDDGDARTEAGAAPL